MDDPTTEKARRYLQNIYENYQMDSTGSVNNSYKIKCLASMEILLVLLGVLGAGQPLNRPVITKTINLLWVFPIVYTGKERYEDFILRLAYGEIKSL